jgi:hypothetical protein
LVTIEARMFFVHTLVSRLVGTGENDPDTYIPTDKVTATMTARDS